MGIDHKASMETWLEDYIEHQITDGNMDGNSQNRMLKFIIEGDIT